MALSPLHPSEPALHHALRDALNQNLKTTDFFVWINVRPTGDQGDFHDLDRIVSDVDQWLSELEPDAVDATDLPERRYVDGAAEVEVRAVPKKPSARDSRSLQVVGNPEPVLAGWLP